MKTHIQYDSMVFYYWHESWGLGLVVIGRVPPVLDGSGRGPYTTLQKLAESASRLCHQGAKPLSTKQIIFETARISEAGADQKQEYFFKWPNLLKSGCKNIWHLG
jgi:hypothetical protein